MRLIFVMAVMLTASNAAVADKLPKKLLSDALRAAQCTVGLDEALRRSTIAGKLPGGMQLLAATCWHGAYSYGCLLYTSPCLPSVSPRPI